MPPLPTLDAHAHVDARGHVGAFGGCGAVLGQTTSLDEAERSVRRREPNVCWGAGCHPRVAAAQAAFDPDRFRALLDRTPLAGEIGLDTGSRVPMERQREVFRTVLRAVADRPRLASVHAFPDVAPVLEELRRTPIAAPILHWWTGRAPETDRAVELGCYFSIHSAVARRSIWRTRVPMDRILVESDHGWRDPPDAIPLRIGWVEHLVAQNYGITVTELRTQVWRNLGALVALTATLDLLPAVFRSTLGVRRAAV